MGTLIAVGPDRDVLAGKALVRIYDRECPTSNGLTYGEATIGECDGSTNAH